MKKVVKFGGSSLANAEQFRKVGEIISSETSRRFVIPSAPGKRSRNDTKVTDMLYACYGLAEEGRDFSHELRLILLEQEPRIQDVEVRCERLDQHSGAVVIHVSYTVRSTNNRYNHVYPFYATEGSEGGGAV